MNILIGLLTVIHVLVALFMIVLVLMQKSKDQGVGAAFGGGITETVFGAGTTTALVRLTIYCACALLGTTLILAVLHSHRNRSSGGSLMQKSLRSAPASTPQPSLPLQPELPKQPATTPAPGTPAPAPPDSSAP